MSEPLGPETDQQPYRTDETTPFLSDVSHRLCVIPLNGWLERNGYTPVFTAALVLGLGFVTFQVLGGLAAVLLVVVREGAAVLENPSLLLEAHVDLLLVGNSIGQYLGLALPVWLVALLHSRSPAPFLRLHRPDGRQLLLSILGLLALLPVVQWISYWNALLPLPESIAEFEKQQMDFLARVLSGETSLYLNLFALAVTPALCEEVFFRGYIQRQLERGLGVGAAIVVTGIVFGFFHMRLSQVIALSLLGVYLGYVTWRTGSLWPAILIHFANNGLALLVSGYVEAHPELGVESFDTMAVPLYIVIPALLLFGLAVKSMNRDAALRLGVETVRLRA